MKEGHQRALSLQKNFIKHNEKEAHIFLQKLTDACFIYLKKQVEAGADVIQIFDSWANLLNADQYEAYSMRYVKKLIALLKEDKKTSDIPIILFEDILKDQIV